jgi:hypothetical protein
MSSTGEEGIVSYYDSNEGYYGPSEVDQTKEELETLTDRLLEAYDELMERIWQLVQWVEDIDIFNRLTLLCLRVMGCRIITVERGPSRMSYGLRARPPPARVAIVFPCSTSLAPIPSGPAL